jgi:signal recognition particle subunit SEC65
MGQNKSPVSFRTFDEWSFRGLSLSSISSSWRIKMIKNALAAFCTVALLSAVHLPAQAQKPPAPTAPSSAPTAAQPSKDEVQKFAGAIKQILTINKVSEAQAVQAIQGEGLTPQRFDEIYKSQADPKAKPATQVPAKERQSYDRAVAKLVAIQKDSQTKMEKAVQDQGLNVQRFNQIFEAIQKNPQLKQEVQQLIRK